MQTILPNNAMGGTDTSSLIGRSGPGQFGSMSNENEARENLVGFFKVLLAVDAQRSRQ